MDVADATSGVPRLWNSVPGAVQTLQGTDPQLRRTFRPDPGSEDYAGTLDGFAVPGFPGLVCNEQAFQYLLQIERRRSERTQGAFFLILIDGAAVAGGGVGPDRLFPIVCNAVRETDFVGWYRQGAVMGATLTQDGRTDTTPARAIVRDRIVQALHNQLPSPLVSQLRLRLYEVLGDDELRIE